MGRFLPTFLHDNSLALLMHAVHRIVFFLPDLTYMKTERGTNLLTSGWWGKSRHPNYVRDLIRRSMNKNILRPSATSV